MNNLSTDNATPKTPPKLPPQDWDVVVAAALDSADRAETAARENGSSRLASASIRHLRWVIRQVAAAGTPNALADAPTDTAPAELRFAHQDGAA